MNVFAKWVSLILFALSSAYANSQDVHGSLRVVKGDVQIKSAKTGQTVKARLGEQVFPKDVVITGKDARAKIVMVDNNEINVSPESQVEIQHYEFDPSAGKKDVLLNVLYGKVRSKVEQKYDGKTTKFQIKTPGAVAGVRGTDFIASYDKPSGNSQIVTFQGKVEFGMPGPGGTIRNPVYVTPGNSATAAAGGSPSAPIAVPKDDLAKMDRDSKAEPSGGNSSGDQRQPAGGDKGSKNDSSRTPAATSGSTSTTGGGNGGGTNAVAGGPTGSGPTGPGTPPVSPGPPPLAGSPQGPDLGAVGGGLPPPPPAPPPPQILPPIPTVINPCPPICTGTGPTTVNIQVHTH